jgi:hypothetical protein
VQCTFTSIQLAEIGGLFGVAPKRQTALSVACGAGLRSGEGIALKVGDIDSERMTLRVEQGKGRYAMLSALARRGARRSALGASIELMPCAAHRLRRNSACHCESRTARMADSRASTSNCRPGEAKTFSN